MIEAESVLAVGVFLARTPSAYVFFGGWRGRGLVRPPGWEVYRERWGESKLANRSEP